MSIIDVPLEVWHWYGDQNVIWYLRATCHFFDDIIDISMDTESPGRPITRGRYCLHVDGTVQENLHKVLVPIKSAEMYDHITDLGFISLASFRGHYYADAADARYYARIFGHRVTLYMQNLVANS